MNPIVAMVEDQRHHQPGDSEWDQGLHQTQSKIDLFFREISIEMHIFSEGYNVGRRQTTEASRGYRFQTTTPDDGDLPSWRRPTTTTEYSIYGRRPTTE